jgi:hypothetical protein
VPPEGVRVLARVISYPKRGNDSRNLLERRRSPAAQLMPRRSTHLLIMGNELAGRRPNPLVKRGCAWIRTTDLLVPKLATFAISLSTKQIFSCKTSI